MTTGMFTPEVKTPYGWMSRTEIDQQIKALWSAQTQGTLTPEGWTELQCLRRIRSAAIRGEVEYRSREWSPEELR